MVSILEESKKAKKKGILGIFKNKKILMAAAVLILGGGGWYYYGGRGQAETTATTIKNAAVKKGDIEIAIDTDGKVVAEDGVDLSFSVSGDNLEVEEVYVKEGQIIKKGDKIASVSTDTLEFSVRSAYAGYQSTLASFNEKMAGATEEEKTKAKDSINQAELSLDQTKISLEKTRASDQAKIKAAEDALETALENLNKNRDEFLSEDVNDAYKTLVNTIKSADIALASILPDSDEILGVDKTYLNDDFEHNLGVKDISTLSRAQDSYVQARNAKDDLAAMAAGLAVSSAHTDIDAAADKVEAVLETLEKHLYDMSLMLRSTITSTDLTQSELDAFLATINANRSSVNTKISSFDTSRQTITDAKEGLEDYEEAYDDAVEALADAKDDAVQNIKNGEASVAAKELSLRQAKDNYEELLAPLTDAELASARSQLTSASISLEKAQLDLKKATILSPIDGQIAALNYKAGDIITDTAKSVATVINNDTLFIEVNIEEAEISKIKVGDRAIASFDALNGDEIPGEISFISLTSGSSNNGIVTYLVRVLLDNSAKKDIREGMTAAVKFVTAGVEDVLSIPVEAVRNVGGKPSVQTATGEWKAVTTGFTDGKYVEVISGLNEGDRIIY
ncbi:MAG: efflux RND transporter periplasmic adaptor subunit [Candidatus Falkowbacteria bacterium]